MSLSRKTDFACVFLRKCFNVLMNNNKISFLSALTLTSLFFITGLTTATKAHATPALNDRNDYRVQVIQLGNYKVGNVVVELTDYDENLDQFLQKTTAHFFNETHTKEEWMNRRQFYTNEQVQDTLNHCSRYGGWKQLLTVAAGTFETCSLPVRGAYFSGTAWIGDVPFGIVKTDLNQTGGTPTRIISELQDYDFGSED